MREALRWAWMVAGMTVLALGIRLQVMAGLGLGPWDVLHMGLSRTLPITFGQATQLVGFTLILACLALRFPVRAGTVLNMIYVGIAYDLIARWLPIPDRSGPTSGGVGPSGPGGWWGSVAGGAGASWLYLVVGVWVLALGSAWYLSAGTGAGPRDGLMLALAARLMGGGQERPRSLWPVRAGIEGSATLTGYLLGGPVGAGTLAVAALMGPAVASMVWLLAPVRRFWERTESGEGAAWRGRAVRRRPSPQGGGSWWPWWGSRIAAKRRPG